VIDAVYALPITKIVVSGWLAGIVRDKFHQEPAALVPNSVDLKQFHAPPRGKQTVPTIGMFYARERIKGLDIGLKGYQLAKEKLPNLRLVVLSNAPQVPEYPVPPEAEWIPQARGDQLRTNLARCDAWVWPSREEGFGLPLLEASACRTPVIAAPAGAAPEILAKGGGILVPPESPQAIADAIVKICSLPEAEWVALSDKALAAAQGFTWDDAARMFEEALVKIAGKK
jgi:glycosyltransferase involved in cell wall biosynthesis